MKYKLLYLLLLTVLMVQGTTALGKSSWNGQADQRRADYIYMEAQRQLAVDNTDAYFELLRRAYALNPRESSVGHDLGFYLLMLAQGDEEMSGKGLKMLETYFLEHPDDYYASVLYGSMCERLGLQDRSVKVWEKLHDIFPSKSDITMRLADVYLSHTTDSLDQVRTRALIDTLQQAEG